MIYLIAVFLPSSFQTTSRFILMQMVVDKETKMKESLRIMSMRSAAYGLSYFLTQLIFLFLITVLLMGVFVYKSFIPAVDIFPFICAMLLNGISQTFLSMSLTTLFSDSKIAVQLGSLILFLPAALFIGLLNKDINDPWRLYFGYFLPDFPTNVIVANQASISIPLNMTVTWLALAVQPFLYFLLYVYLDQVMPDTFGISKSCCFCLKRKRAVNRYSEINVTSEINNEEGLI